MIEATRMADPWYQDGLRFRCTRCGNCCTGEPGYVWVNAEEIEQISAFRGEAVEVVSQLYVREVGRRRTLREQANGDCVFFERGQGCLIYPVRPRQCRSWPFWESNLLSPETWQQTCSICPGAGQGDLIPCEEITRNLKLIRM